MKRIAAPLAVVVLVAIGAVESSVSAQQLAEAVGRPRLEGAGVTLTAAGLLASAAIYLVLGYLAANDRAHHQWSGGGARRALCRGAGLVRHCGARGVRRAFVCGERSGRWGAGVDRTPAQSSCAVATSCLTRSMLPSAWSAWKIATTSGSN